MAYETPKPPTPGVTLTPDQPIDDLAAATMQTIARKGRGFVLGTAKDGDKTRIEVLEQPPVHDEWLPRAALRAHTILDTESFIAYAQKYGTADGSLVLFDQEGAELVLAEQIDRGERELVTMPFVPSADWRDWTDALSKPLTHKQLLTFLMNHEHNLSAPDMLQAMQSFGMNARIRQNSEVRDDGATVSLIVETNGGEEMKRFPKSFEVHVPVLDQDVVDGADARAVIRMQLNIPDDPMKGPTFTLFCAAWQQVRRQRIDAEAEALREGLDGWTIVSGKHEVREPD